MFPIHYLFHIMSYYNEIAATVMLNECKLGKAKYFEISCKKL